MFVGWGIGNWPADLHQTAPRLDTNLGTVSSQAPPSPSDSTELAECPTARPVRPVYFWSRNKYGFGFQFYSNLILIEVGLQIATVPELPAPAFASTPQRTMMTKRIENPAAVPGRRNQAKSWLSVGTRSCSSAESVRTRAGGAPSAKSTDEQELVPTDDHEWRTDDGEP